jgi:excisionase family DNA binding protein
VTGGIISVENLRSDQRVAIAPDAQYEWITVPEVARMLRISERTIYRLVNIGEIPSRRFGRQTRISRNWLAAKVA